MSDQAPLAIVAADAAPRARQSSYPEPFLSRMGKREKRPLGDVFGLKNFGVGWEFASGAFLTLRRFQLVTEPSSLPRLTARNHHAADDDTSGKLTGLAPRLPPLSRAVHRRLRRVKINSTSDVRQRTAVLVSFDFQQNLLDVRLADADCESYRYHSSSSMFRGHCDNSSRQRLHTLVCQT